MAFSLTRKKPAPTQEPVPGQAARDTLKFFTQAVRGAISMRASFPRQKVAEMDAATGMFLMYIGQVDAPAGPSIAWTDGVNNYYAPGFEVLSPKEKCGVELHEDLHVMLRHVQRGMDLRSARGNDYSPKLWNIVTDAIINETLRLAAEGQSEVYYSFPNNCIFLKEFLKKAFNEDWDAKEAINSFTAESLYFAIKNNEPPQSGNKGKQQQNGKGKKGQGQPGQGQPGQQQGQGGQGQDQQGDGQGQGSKNGAAKPGEGDASSDAGRRVTDWAKEKGWGEDMAEPQHYDPIKEKEDAQDWRSRIAQARQAGTGSMNLLRHVGADMPESRTPWEQILRQVVTHAVNRRPNFVYNRPSRRYISLHVEARRLGRQIPFEPSLSYNQPVPKIGVVFDSSGSIDDDVMSIFLNELRGLRRRTGAETVAMVADDRVQSEITIGATESDSMLRKIKLAGAGGTDFSPALKALDRKDIGVIVYLTDLCGPAHYRPRFVKTVVWAVPKRFGSIDTPPFGRLIEIEG